MKPPFFALALALAIVPSLVRAAPSLARPEKTAEPALHLAAEKGALKKTLRLLAAGANVDERDGSGWTALTHAAAGGHKRVVLELIRAGSSLDAAGKDGTTPLLAAAVLLRPEVVDLLLSSGAAHDLRDSAGDTALMKACTPDTPTRPRASLTAIGRSLLKAGADPNTANGLGWTPLISAAAAGNKDLVSALLAAGADPGARLPNGRSALFFASLKPGAGQDIVRLLKKAGAKD